MRRRWRRGREGGGESKTNEELGRGHFVRENLSVSVSC
jgi:hypothetical protein